MHLEMIKLILSLLLIAFINNEHFDDHETCKIYFDDALLSHVVYCVPAFCAYIDLRDRIKDYSLVSECGQWR